MAKIQTTAKLFDSTCHFISVVSGFNSGKYPNGKREFYPNVDFIAVFCLVSLDPSGEIGLSQTLPNRTREIPILCNYINTEFALLT